MSEETRFERLVGLQVTDEEGYARYRAGMRPILAGYGGSFRWDIRGGEVLEGETDDAINRVFVLSFPSRDASDRFFIDPDYLAVRAAHFDGSVGAAAIIAEYDRQL